MVSRQFHEINSTMHVCNKYQHPNVFFSPVTMQDIRWAIIFELMEGHFRPFKEPYKYNRNGFHWVS